MSRDLPGSVSDDPGTPRTDEMAKPNPGSPAARAGGCICAVLDNNHGRYAPWPPDGWWVTEGCPLHAPANISGRAEQ